MLPWLSPDNCDFPPLSTALKQPDGLLAGGGDLSVERLTAAYRHGCFPWFSPGQPILWWSPNPRTVLFPERFHLSKSLRKTFRKAQFSVTLNQAFAEVITGCAAPRDDHGTWITQTMQTAYQQLHHAGIAHSVEVWQAQELVGGLYGVALGQVFFGESMFSRVSNASKVGFATLVGELKAQQFALIDCQVHTEHLASFGAEPISRTAFADYLNQFADRPSPMDWTPRSLSLVLDKHND